MLTYERLWRLDMEKLWSTQLKDPVTCMKVGKPFIEEMSEENDILIGTSAGRVLTLNQTKPVEDLLETKGGPIQTINLQHLTGIGVAKDLVVGDADGVVTLFSKQQILTKRPVGAPVSFIDIHDNLVGGYEIIVGDTSGTVTSFRQHDILWKLNLEQWSRKMMTEAMAGQQQSATIRCIHSTKLTDAFGLQMSCLLITNGWPMVYLVQQGQCLQTLKAPSTITSMCSGHFLTEHSNYRITNTEASKSKKQATVEEKLASKQVLMAGQDGVIYVMIDFELFPWLQVGHHITQILCFRPSELLSHEPDMIICIGHSNKTHFYHNGEIISEIETKDWPHTMTLGDVNTDGKEELVIGLLDRTIEVHTYRLVR